MPPLKQPQGWRYLKSRLRLLNRPQALGTIAVLLVAGVVLRDYWRRQPVVPVVADPVPAASAPALAPSDPLSTLGRLPIEPSVDSNSPARPAIAPPPPTNLDLLTPIAQPLPNAGNSAPAGTRSSVNRPVPSSNGLIGTDNFTPASPAVSPVDPLRSAIANQTQTPPAATPPVSRMPPYATSPPPGTTGYTLPPTLVPTPSGLPAPRPEVTGLTTPSGYSMAPVVPAVPLPEPQLAPRQSIERGEINSFENP